MIETLLISQDCESSESESGQYTLAMLAKMLSLPLSTLRRWYLQRLLIPVFEVKRLPYFDFSQLVFARELAKILANSPRATAIEKQLSRWARLNPDWQARWSTLDVVIDGTTVLFRQDHNRLVETNGQFRFDFYDNDQHAEGGSPPRILPLESFASPADSITYDELLYAALEHEDRQEPLQAISVYRRLLQTFGPTADACFALAEIFYSVGDLAAARERYYMAVELEESFIEALSNLGCVLVELGELHEAQRVFERALRQHPDYADVHFHLAKLLDQLHAHELAAEHWRRFLQLAPKTPWSEEAKQRLGR